MVYTSIPAYIDPANWQQQQPNHQPGNNTGATGSHLILPPPPPQPQPPSQPHGPGGTTAGSIRPGSMADKARMANIPMQEAPQKCPRCDSTNTKFCYFNNYSLLQPRHFCKTCRRYWTRGGALRNVPVGGGCRRNKRSRGTSSGNSVRSPANSDRQTASAGSASTTSGSSSADMVVGLGSHVPSSLRFMAPLHQLSDHHHHLGGGGGGDGGGEGGGGGGGGGGGEIGLNYGWNYGTISGPMGGVGDLNFHIGSTLSGGGSVLSGLDQWRVPQTHQFPFLSGLEASSSHGLYPFESGSGDAYGGGGHRVSTCGVISQLASVKMEDNHEHGLPRHFLGMNNNPNTTQQYWSGGGGAAAGAATAAWTDLSAFSSSSTTSNPL